jgi:hypothetical protein
MYAWQHYAFWWKEIQIKLRDRGKCLFKVANDSIQFWQTKFQLTFVNVIDKLYVYDCFNKWNWIFFAQINKIAFNYKTQ